VSAGQADKVARIKELYLQATRQSIRRDLETAIEILKSIETEDERQRVAVFMDGLSQLRSEWALARQHSTHERRKPRRG
jgi:hypothetical protein